MSRESITLHWPLLLLDDMGVVSCREVVHGDDPDITALAVRGGAIWLGTRSGYLLILDSSLMEEGKAPLLGLQQCGTGKVKCIVPVVNANAKVQVKHTPYFTLACCQLGQLSQFPPFLPLSLPPSQVLCSLEFPDEVSCHLLTWEYFHSPGHRSSNCNSPSHTLPVHKPL